MCIIYDIMFINNNVVTIVGFNFWVKYYIC